MSFYWLMTVAHRESVLLSLENAFWLRDELQIRIVSQVIRSMQGFRIKIDQWKCIIKTSIWKPDLTIVLFQFSVSIFFELIESPFLLLLGCSHISPSFPNTHSLGCEYPTCDLLVMSTSYNAFHYWNNSANGNKHADNNDWKCEKV